MKRIFFALLLSAMLLLGYQIVANSKCGYNSPLLIKSLDNPMPKPFKVLIQYLAPQHALSHLAGWLGESRIPWLKNFLIKQFLNRFDVDMSAAIIEDPFEYPTFNSFFTRQLKPEARPIAPQLSSITSPADGYISQIGKINNSTLLQAKGVYFDLKSLLGGSESLAQEFTDGNFATIYLSPKDYHRVHMPATGTLRKTIFIPGSLFSVSQLTAEFVPQLFARNERLVSIFDTDQGPIAVILVGAMLVGSIETVWQGNIKASTIQEETYDNSLTLNRGAELGLFKWGSTVILLFGKDRVNWLTDLHEGVAVKMGQLIGQHI